jgi:hypothetical protein
MQESELISQNTILSNVLMFIGDNDLKKGITKGFYISAIQKAIEDLSIATFYDVQTADFKLDHHTLQMLLPNNCFNIREVYLWNGDCCQPESSVIVHFKRLMNNKPNGGDDYTALKHGGGHKHHDPFYHGGGEGGTNGGRRRGNLYFAGVQNGLLMFSSNAKSYKNVRIVYNGFGGEIGDPPLVPRLLRSVVEDMVCCTIFRALMAREARYGSLYKEYNDRLYNERTGAFWSAKKNLSALDSWVRQDYSAYQNRGNW